MLPSGWPLEQRVRWVRELRTGNRLLDRARPALRSPRSDRPTILWQPLRIRGYDVEPCARFVSVYVPITVSIFFRSKAMHLARAWRTEMERDRSLLEAESIRERADGPGARPALPGPTSGDLGQRNTGNGTPLCLSRRRTWYGPRKGGCETEMRPEAQPPVRARSIPGIYGSGPARPAANPRLCVYLFAVARVGVVVSFAFAVSLSSHCYVRQNVREIYSKTLT